VSRVRHVQRRGEGAAVDAAEGLADFGQTVELWWRKRRLVCGEVLCPRKTFTQVSIAVRPRARVTERLRQRVAHAIASSNRAVSDVACEFGVSWPTAHKALVVAAAKWLPEPVPTSRLGIDETRFRSVRWILDGLTWRRSDPWLTSFVDCSRDGPGSLLGLAPGRTGACVREWLGEQSEEFRNAIKIVVIDPSAPYASGIRGLLRDHAMRSSYPSRHTLGRSGTRTALPVLICDKASLH
jgi:transposase